LKIFASVRQVHILQLAMLHLAHLYPHANTASSGSGSGSNSSSGGGDNCVDCGAAACMRHIASDTCCVCGFDGDAYIAN